jgi:polyhydroxybutyrate depolymerase
MLRLALSLITLATATLCSAQDPHTTAQSLLSGGKARTYLLHVPASYSAAHPAPLLVVMHGLGGNGQSMEDVTGFSAMSDQEGFVVAYPDALDNTWFDHAGAPLDGNVAFIGDLIAALRARYAIDGRRIFASGMSQGAGMSYLVCAAMPATIAAIAPVVGGIPIGYDLNTVMPARPVPVLIMNGTADQLVNYYGGWGSAGFFFRSAPDLAWTFAMHDGCFFIPFTYDLPNWNWFDGCTASVTSYGFGVQGSEVVLYTITGGGHTWPGSRIWLPQFIFGNTCYDFDGSRVIWDFFTRHPLPAGTAN